MSQKKLLVKRGGGFIALVALVTAMLGVNGLQAHTAHDPEPSLQLPIIAATKTVDLTIEDDGSTVAEFHVKKAQDPMINLWYAETVLDFPLDQKLPTSECPASADVNQIVKLTVGAGGFLKGIVEYDLQNADGSVTDHQTKTVLPETDVPDNQKTFKMGLCVS